MNISVDFRNILYRGNKQRSINCPIHGKAGRCGRVIKKGEEEKD